MQKESLVLLKYILYSPDEQIFTKDRSEMLSLFPLFDDLLSELLEAKYVEANLEVKGGFSEIVSIKVSALGKNHISVTEVEERQRIANEKILIEKERNALEKEEADKIKDRKFQLKMSIWESLVFPIIVAIIVALVTSFIITDHTAREEAKDETLRVLQMFFPEKFTVETPTNSLSPSLSNVDTVTK